MRLPLLFALAGVLALCLTGSKRAFAESSGSSTTARGNSFATLADSAPTPCTVDASTSTIRPCNGILPQGFSASQLLVALQNAKLQIGRGSLRNNGCQIPQHVGERNCPVPYTLTYFNVDNQWADLGKLPKNARYILGAIRQEPKGSGKDPKYNVGYNFGDSEEERIVVIVGSAAEQSTRDDGMVIAHWDMYTLSFRSTLVSKIPWVDNFVLVYRDSGKVLRCKHTNDENINSGVYSDFTNCRTANILTDAAKLAGVSLSEALAARPCLASEELECDGVPKGDLPKLRTAVASFIPLYRAQFGAQAS